MATLAPEATSESLPRFPLPRPPLGPPEEFREFRKQPWLTPVRMWNGRRAWLVTRYDDVRTLLADKRFSANPATPGFPTISAGRGEIFEKGNPFFIRFDGAEHARLRKMFLPEFTIKRVEEWRNLIQRITDDLIDGMLAGPKPADFVKAFALRLPSNVLTHILGVPEEDHEFFQNCTGRFVDVTLSPEENLKADEEFRNYVEALVDRKTADASSDDLVTRLIRDHFLTGAMSRKELLGSIQLLFIAGHETTANTIALGMILLLLQPEAYAAIGASGDPDVLRNAVEELLRHTSVVQYQCARVALEDVEFRGHLIRKGEGILPMIHGANRDPERYDDPERLDIFRQPSTPHVAFGFGPHQCLGQALARLELTVAFGTLARRIPTLRLAGTLDDVVFRGQGLTHGVANMMVTW